MIQEQTKSIYAHITNTISIEEVLTRLGGLGLTKTGKDYAGQCPTGHPSESQKSFNVIPDKNFYFCHSCKISGNVIDLVKLTKNCSHQDAIQWFRKEFDLSDFFDPSFHYYKEPTPEEKEAERIARLKTIILEDVVQAGKKALFEDMGKDVLSYLTVKRKYNPEVLKDTDFFYLPDTNEVKKLLNNEYPDFEDILNKIKLNGYFGDNFRLAIPYRDRYGNITGLLKRSISPEGEQITTFDGKEHNKVRWDSSSGTKKDDLFGLHRIKKTDTVLIVEGYPDAEYLYHAGIKNITAIGQGVLSKKHLVGLEQKRIKYAILCLDNDKVGPDNTIRAVKTIFSESNIIPYVIDPKNLHPHKDPDEYVREEGIDAFKRIIGKAESGVKWLVGHELKNYTSSSDIEKAILMEELYSFAATLTSTTLVNEITEELSAISGLTKRVIESELKKRYKKSMKAKKRRHSIDSKERYFCFIERNQGIYGLYDKKKDHLNLGIKEEMLKKILLDEDQELSENPPVLDVIFDPTVNKKISFDKEYFNLFTPTDYMLYTKNDENIIPDEDFPSINKILCNLFLRQDERERFINWLSGIIQTREKQLTSWVLKGVEGAGKGILLRDIIKPIFGDQQAIQVENQQLTEKYNSYLQNALLVAFNEVAHDDQTMQAVNSKVKAIITDSEILINEKWIKGFYIQNYVNCLFFSNISVPLLVGKRDRRFNIIVTGDTLRDKTWFDNPKQFLLEIKKELPKFAQYLTNYKYDPELAMTVIKNEEKDDLVNVKLDKFEEFASKIKANDKEWFKENADLKGDFVTQQNYVNGMSDRITKDEALAYFNAIYNDKISKVTLAKKLKLHGIIPYRDQSNGKQYFVAK